MPLKNAKEKGRVLRWSLVVGRKGSAMSCNVLVISQNESQKSH